MTDRPDSIDLTITAQGNPLYATLSTGTTRLAWIEFESLAAAEFVSAFLARLVREAQR